MKANVAILIPTYNQPKALYNTLYSIFRWTRSVFRIYVIDNSPQQYAELIASRVSPDIVVLKQEKNLGWQGGINEGIKNSSEDFVMFLNDDIKVLDWDYLWLQKLLEVFTFTEKCGVAVPTSNVVMGRQDFVIDSPALIEMTPLVSGMCVLTKREIINKVGLLDDKLYGGDDLDFAIRVKEAGYRLFIRRDVFLFHFGSLTGKSLFGTDWNSKEYSDKVNRDIIRKHGFKKYIDLFNLDDTDVRKLVYSTEWEKEVMLPYCIGNGIEVGCGANKVKDDVIGVDITPKGERGNAGCQLGRKSEADITVVDTKLPFDTSSKDFVVSRHVLEHIVDDIEALREWVRVLKHSGILMICVPNESMVDGMPLDPTHKHAYTISSLKNKLSLICDYEILLTFERDISFVFIARVIK